MKVFLRRTRSISRRLSAVYTRGRGIFHRLVALFVLCLMFWTAECGAQPIQREKQTPEAQLRFAEGLVARKFYDMAEDELRNFLDRYPNHKLAPHAMLLLIECLKGEGKEAEMLSAINQFLARWPNDPTTAKLYFYKGELLLRQKKFEQAEACFSRLKLNPDPVWREAGLYFLAKTYENEGKIDLASATYRLLASKPFDKRFQYRPYAVFALASAAWYKGRFADAEALFSKIVKAGQDAVPPQLFEEALYRLAELQFLKGEYAAAAKVYDELLVRFPEGRFAREARKRRAWAFLNMGKARRALELIREWRRRYPEADDYEADVVEAQALVDVSLCGEALPVLKRLAGVHVPKEYRRWAAYRQVWCLLSLGRYGDAVRAAEAYVDEFGRTGDAADVLFFEGEAWFKLGMYEKAVQALRNAQTAGGANWTYSQQAGGRLAEALAALKRHREAAQVYRRLAEASAGKADAAVYLLNAARQEREAGRIDAAIHDCKNVLEKFAGTPAAFKAGLLLTELYAETSRYAEAETFLRKLLGIAKDRRTRARLTFFLGYLAYAQKKSGEAEKRIREALAAGLDSTTAGTARWYLAGALLDQNKEEEALKEFSEVLKLPPERRRIVDPELLLRIADAYFRHHDYATSEAVCRWAIQQASPEQAVAVTVRLAEILVAAKRLDEARKLLEKLLRGMEQKKTTPEEGVGEYTRADVLTVYGEVLTAVGEHDRAVGAFEQSLADPGKLNQESLARAHWGLAHILFTEGRLKQALYHAVRTFLTCDDPVYTPRAMLIAVRILVKQNKIAEARTTWEELKVRYPSFAQQHEDDADVQAVIRKEGGSGAADKRGADRGK